MKRGKRQAYVSKIMAIALSAMLICSNLVFPLHAEGETTLAAEPTKVTHLTELKDGATVAVYNPASKQMMTSALINSKYIGSVTVEEEADGLVVPADANVLKVVKADQYYQFVKDGKYLTYNDGGFKYEAAPDATGLSDWELIDTDKKGEFIVKNKVAEFRGNKEQCFKYYADKKNFCIRGKNKNLADFTMKFYPATEQTPVDPPVDPQPQKITRYTELVDGSKIVIYNPHKGKLMSSTVNGLNITALSVRPDKDDVLTVPEGAATFTLEKQGEFYHLKYGEMYLSSGATTDAKDNKVPPLKFEAKPTEYSLWDIQKVDDKGGFTIRNTEAVFKGGKDKNQYLDYFYDSKNQSELFKLNRMNNQYKDFYIMNLYPAEQYKYLTEVKDGAEFVVYNPSENQVMSNIVTGKYKNELEGILGKFNEKDELVVTKKALVLKAELQADGTFFLRVGNKYLTSDKHSNIKIKDKADEFSNWDIQKSQQTGEFLIHNVNAPEKNKYIEFYKGSFKLYKLKTDNLKPYTLKLYPPVFESEKVKNVIASPDSGKVVKGTEVTLLCETEGATIKYSEDGGQTWLDYTAPLKIDTLPKSYQVKAVKPDYIDSDVTTLNYEARKNNKYNIYFGQLHSHTTYSDGSGTADEAFKYASGVDNLDFLAVTDHSNSFDNDKRANINDGSMSTEWTEGRSLAEKYTKNGEFVGLFGYEMTWSGAIGHINTFNSKGFQSRNQDEFDKKGPALKNYFEALKKSPNSISQFNHPGTTFGDFTDFAHYDTEIDKLVTTIEVGNGEGPIGSSGYFPSYEYYQRALDKGWHVAPTNNQDNHKGKWGDSNTARSVVLADELTQSDVYDAMRNYRVYATEDNDLNIYYTLDGREMGSILPKGQTGKTVNLRAELTDLTDKSIGKVQVITNGGIKLAETDVKSNDEVVEFTVDNKYSYYYLKIIQSDGDIAVTAPVWTAKVEAAGISKLSTEDALPVKGESLKVDFELYNNEDEDMTVQSIEFKVGDEVVHTVDLKKAKMDKVSALDVAAYSFDFMHEKAGKVALTATVNATLYGAPKVYTQKLNLTYVVPEIVTKVVIDGTHFNDYVSGYYKDNVGNFTKLAAERNVKVRVIRDKITKETLKDCKLLIVSAPAKGRKPDDPLSHFEDEFIKTVKEYTDNGGTLIACGIADYQDGTQCQTSTEMNKLLSAIGATTKLNSDEAWDDVNNGGEKQQFRLYLDKIGTSKYLTGAQPGQKYSAYSGCTVNMDKDKIAAGKATALVMGHDTTYSVNTKDDNGNSLPKPHDKVVKEGEVVVLGHEVLDSGANLFVSSTVFVSDFEVKVEMDNIWDLPYLNKTIVENILDEVAIELPISTIETVRKANEDEVFTVEGYVTAGRDNEHNRFFDAFYIQDETGGLTIFPYGESDLALGDKVRVTGYVDYYQGDKEIQIIKCEKLADDKKVIDPTLLSTKDAMNYDKNGGKLVKVKGTVTRIGDAKDGAVNQFWVKDESGVEANIFIDGYIKSGTTGKNELGSIVKVGATVEAVGLVYAHPEGNSDVPVTCMRVRNCDEIKAVAGDAGSGNAGQNQDANQNNQNGNNGQGQNTNQSGNAAQTGDETPIMDYVVILLAAAVVVAALIAYRRKAVK